MSNNDDNSRPEQYAGMPPWLQANSSDLDLVHVDGPLKDCVSAEPHHLSKLYHQSSDSEEASVRNVYIMLSSIMRMHGKFSDKNEPYGPMMQFSNGSRTAIPDDFLPAHVPMLVSIANETKNDVLKSRVSDIAWLLDRKRVDMARTAISSFLAIVKKTTNNKLHYSDKRPNHIFHHLDFDCLRRALQIAWTLGSDSSEFKMAQAATRKHWRHAAASRDLSAVLHLGELILDYNRRGAKIIGSQIRDILTENAETCTPLLEIELWKLAARAFSVAKANAERNSCIIEVANCFIDEADKEINKSGSFILAAHHITSAIAFLHGIPEAKDLRLELRHRLVDIQAEIPNEIGSFSEEFDLSENVRHAKEAISRAESILDLLFLLASCCRPEEPDSLIKSAKKHIEEYPLQFLMNTAHIDSEGKTVHWSSGATSPDMGDETAIKRQISFQENIRRFIAANSEINVLMDHIYKNFYISEDLIRTILIYSPFVPRDLIGTYTRGFTRFLQGDTISAIYILTPLLENSLRVVLKQHGHDVTTFDDSTQTQQDRTISSLFDQMRGELEAIFRPATILDIETLFLSRPGPTIRHTLSHGLLDDNDPYESSCIYACCLILRLCLIPLYSRKEKIVEELHSLNLI